MLYLAYGAATTLALLGSYTLPVIVGAVMDGLGFDARRAGLIGAAEVSAMAVASLLVAPLVGSMSVRRVALVCVAVIATVNLLSMIPADFYTLLGLRLIVGVAAGTLYATVVAAIAGSPDPDRLYASVTMVVTLVTGALFMLLPWAIDFAGHRGVFCMFAAIAVAVGPLVLPLPRVTIAPTLEQCAGISGADRASSLVLASALVVSAGAQAIWMYAERIGRHVGMSIEAIGVTLAAATELGILGPLLVVWLGTRFGRTTPLAISMCAVGLSALSLGYADARGIFAAALLLYSASYLLVQPLLLGAAAAVDTRGRVAAATGGMLLVGGAVGSTVAGGVLAGESFVLLAWLVAGCCAVAMMLILPLTLNLERRARSAPLDV